MLNSFGAYFDGFLNKDLDGPVMFIEPLEYDVANLVIKITIMERISLKQLHVGQVNNIHLAIPENQDLV